MVALAVPASATFPFPSGGDPLDYTRLHITNGSCTPAPGEVTDLPAGFDCKREWELTDYAAQPGDDDYDPEVASSPQELFGVKGPGTNRAWEVTTGRPDTIIAVMDSGIRWADDTPELVNKFYLNMGELPVPCAALLCGTRFSHDPGDYDVTGDGVFNVQDYASDPRVSDFPDDNNGYLDPADLIRTFSDGLDQDGNGYPDDISGWDFYERDNNAQDDVDYGHGTGESRDSAAEIELTTTQCPNCMLMELRVGDSFIAEINNWAQAVVYATDNGASVVQEALGTLDHTGFAQAAADYAYEHGLIIVASEADEAAGHHNYPAALNHTMAVNSITRGFDAPESPKTYLALNGCTNFGGYTWMSVSSASCSSGATGQASGMAGLLISAARNAVDQGIIEPGADGRPLRAEETKQLFRLAADDIDFSTPRGGDPANNFKLPMPRSRRYTTTAGWDQITGWGRPNISRAVRIVQAGQIPPIADIVSPRWWQPLGTSGTVDVVGMVAAPRAASYTYQVQFAPGVQPPKHPRADTWTTVATGGGSTPRTGVLGTVSLAAVRAAIRAAVPPYTSRAEDPTDPSHPEKDAFRVRVVVSDDRPETGDAIEQRQYFSVAQPHALPGMPRYLGADGVSSPALVDLDGDGADELVVADGNGFVHTFTHTGGELPGWPVHTDAIPLPGTGAPAYTRGLVPSTVYAPVLLGSPVVADLNGDGSPEISVAAVDGRLYVWDVHGDPLPGFPVQTNPDYSTEPGCQTAIGPQCDDWTVAHDVRDELNTMAPGFSASPSAGDLDLSYPGLELVVGANDDHVYAWHADGTPVPGWPVFIGDPAKIAAVDPVTHKVTYKANANALRGRKIITTPSLGDADGDGFLDVAVNTNETYREIPNYSPTRAPLLFALQLAGESGNTRTYLLHHDGTLHPPTLAQRLTAHPADQAYKPGWPVRIGSVLTGILPNVGEGSNGSPVMADVDGDGTLEIATVAVAGPPYLLTAGGRSYYGADSRGLYVTMTSSLRGSGSRAHDAPSIVALGGGSFGRLGRPGSALLYMAGGGGLKRFADIGLPEQQTGGEDEVGAWIAGTGDFARGFPTRMNDMQFFTAPAVADVTGDGKAELIQGSAMYDVQAFRERGARARGWPKFTGGWMVGSPAVGDFDGNGFMDVAVVVREGLLYVWRTPAPACAGADWPKYQHDLHNTGNFESGVAAPGECTR